MSSYIERKRDCSEKELEGDSSRKFCRVLFHWVTPLLSSRDRRERAHSRNLLASHWFTWIAPFRVIGISRRVAKAATSGGLLSAAVRSFSGTQRRGGPVSATGHKFARAPVVARKTDLRRRQRRVSFFREETVLLPYPRRQEKRTLPRSRISTFYHIGVHARVK